MWCPCITFYLFSQVAKLWIFKQKIEAFHFSQKKQKKKKKREQVSPTHLPQWDGHVFFELLGYTMSGIYAWLLDNSNRQ